MTTASLSQPSPVPARHSPRPDEGDGGGGPFKRTEAKTWRQTASWSGSPFSVRRDLTAQRGILADPGLAADRFYLDHGLTDRNRRPHSPTLR